jgi:hypothetical protein
MRGAEIADSLGVEPCYKCGARNAAAVQLCRHRLWLCQRCLSEALCYDGPASELMAA